MRLAEQKRFVHLRFMGELRTCRSLSYITDYCSINDIYSNEGFQSNITPGEQVQMLKMQANYDARNDFIYGICGTIRTCVVLDNR